MTPIHYPDIPLTARRKQGDPAWMNSYVKRLVNRRQITLSLN